MSALVLIVSMRCF